MARKNGIIFLIILVIFAFTLWVLLPIDSTRFGRKGLHLGLDFAGGVQVAYQAQFSDNTTTAEKSAAMRRVMTVINKRIDSFGVTQAEILKLGDDGVLVRLPGFTDLTAAEKLVEQTGFLEFRVVEKDASGNPVYLSNYISANTTVTNFIDTKETGNRVFVGIKDASGTEPGVAILTRDATGFLFTDVNGKPVNAANLTKYASSPSWVVARGNDSTPLTGALLSDAQPNLQSATGASQAVVDIQWNSEGEALFNQIAARIYDPQGDQGPPNIIHNLGIFLDNNLLSDPKVNSQSYEGGRAVIEGNFNVQSATELAGLLKSGALPVEIIKQAAGEKMISPTLGIEFKNLSWKAGLIGLLLVMVFMTAYYRLPGLMASLALVFYTSLMLAIFKLWPITLSLGDIGGFIVSIGIAVDANVLIFERMREEFRMGRTLSAATEAGFHRAWTAIWDSNVTTFIACIILIWLGSTALNDTTVIGFGVTLFIGAIVSIFTAVTVTRTLLRMISASALRNNPSLFITTGGKKNA